jgi:hypothetical protein
MPPVNPTITGAGMKRMTTPILATPMSTRMTPAMSVAASRPAMPYFAVTPARIATNAPVGPAICTRLPPKAATHAPPIMAVYSPLFRPRARGDRKSHGQGKGDDADDDAGDDVGSPLVTAEKSGRPRLEQSDHASDPAVRVLIRSLLPD